MRRHLLLASLVALAVALGAFGYARAQQAQRRILPGARREVPPALRGGRQPHPPEAEQIRTQQTFPGQVFAYGDRRVPEVALTFDDGPDTEYTPQVLDVLRRKGVRATFYFTGHRTERYPEVARRTVREGHEVGNHSYDHPDLRRLTPEEVRWQLQRTDDIIEQLTGRRVLTFRPPYGALSPAVVEEARRLGYRIILWDVDSLDWQSLTRDQILEQVLPKVQPGSIILFHSAVGGPEEDLSGTVQALPILIDRLRERGLRFVTVSEMFGIIRTRP